MASERQQALALWSVANCRARVKDRVRANCPPDNNRALANDP